MNSATPPSAEFSPSFTRSSADHALPASSKGKTLLRQAFRVGAYRMKGGRMAEVLIGQKGKRGLRYVGSARLAVSSLRKKLFSVLRMLRVYTFCPFAGLLGDSAETFRLPEHTVAECQWVEANVSVWVEFEGWNEKGQLVNPRVVDVS